MMISPETYYEMNLKSKSQEEIMKKIRSLKIQIGQLKRSIEKTDDMVLEVFPSRLTRLKCNARRMLVIGISECDRRVLGILPGGFVKDYCGVIGDAVLMVGRLHGI